MSSAVTCVNRMHKVIHTLEVSGGFGFEGAL